MFEAWYANRSMPPAGTLFGPPADTACVINFVTSGGNPCVYQSVRTPPSGIVGDAKVLDGWKLDQVDRFGRVPPELAP